MRLRSRKVHAQLRREGIDIARCTRAHVAGMVYVAFVIDAFSRRIVGWNAAMSMTTDLVLSPLEQAPHDRGQRLDQLIHHSDAGSQYVSIAYGERLADAEIDPSVGSVGDSYDNALAETIIGLFKTEVVRLGRPWRGLDDLELDTFVWVDWFNHSRLSVRSATSHPPSTKPTTTVTTPPGHPGRSHTRSQCMNPGRLISAAEDGVPIHHLDGRDP